jgi:hypothetical protein
MNRALAALGGKASTSCERYRGNSAWGRMMLAKRGGKANAHMLKIASALGVAKKKLLKQLREQGGVWEGNA